MSIGDEIKDRVSRRMLYPLLPQAPGETVRRAMFVAEPLWNLLNSPKGDLDWERRIGELRADLETFVTGTPVHPKYLFLLYPARDGVWEIRSVENDPSIRVLGLFAIKDVYVATNFAERRLLDGWQSRGWKEVKRTASATWRWLFPSYRPVITTKIHRVVSDAVNGRYYKDRG